jgi:hypothetical protein
LNPKSHNVENLSRLYGLAKSAAKLASAAA